MSPIFKKLFHPVTIVCLAGILLLTGIVWLVFLLNKAKTICPKCNIIVIDIDSLRADELPCFGYYRNTAPNICAIAKEGVIFEKHLSQSGWTMPNIFSFLTSLNPEIHGVKKFNIDKLDFKFKSLVEDIKDSGYQTVWAGESWDNTISRGFSSIYPDSSDPKQWLSIVENLHGNYKKDKTSFFVYFYGGNLHFPFRVDSRADHEWLNGVPEDFPATFSEVDEVIKLYFKENYKDVVASKATPNQIADAYSEIFKDHSNIYLNVEKLIKFYGLKYSQPDINGWSIINDAYTKRIKDLTNKYDRDMSIYSKTIYDVRVSQIDRDLDTFIGQLLNNQDYSRDTIIVFLSDHGDEFMEHEGFEHSTLYNELLWIPLIIKTPGIHPRRIKEQTQTIDVFPTLLDLVGVRTPKSIQGFSLLPLMFGNKDKSWNTRYIISSKADVAAIQNDKWKLIEWYSAATTDRELYYLAEDPGEKENVAKEFPQIVTDLSQKLKEARNIH